MYKKTHRLFHSEHCKLCLFTLVELLIIIAIIAILAGLLLPSLKKARTLASEISCISQGKQLALGSHSYANDYVDYLPHAGISHTSESDSWNALIARYVGVGIENSQTLQRGIFNCPTQKNGNSGEPEYGDNGFYGGYAWNFKNMGWRVNTYGWAVWVKRNQLQKPSRTIMLGDTPDKLTAPAEFFYLYSNYGVDYYPVRHNNGGNMAWADAHISHHKPIQLNANLDWWKIK